MKIAARRAALGLPEEEVYTKDIRKNYVKLFSQFGPSPVGAELPHSEVFEESLVDEAPLVSEIYDELQWEQAVPLLVKKLVSHLSEKKQTILRARFGLDGTPIQTLEEIGVSYEVSRERIRQIEAEALGELRELMAQWLPRDLRGVKYLLSTEEYVEGCLRTLGIRLVEESKVAALTAPMTEAAPMFATIVTKKKPKREPTKPKGEPAKVPAPASDPDLEGLGADDWW